MRRTILILSVLMVGTIPALADDSAIKVVGGAVQMGIHLKCLRVGAS